MKKIVFIISSLLFALLLSVMAFADENDCRNISKEERDAIGVEDTETLIRVYNGAYLHGFANNEKIEDLTSSKYVLEEILVSFRKDDYESITCYRIDNSLVNNVHGLEKASVVLAEYTSESTVEKLEKKIGSTIRGVVCLCGEPSHDGIYIYYKTDIGDFVLYKEYASSDNAFLFPINDFYAFAKAFYEKKLSTLYDNNGEVRKGASLRLEDEFDLKEYKLSLNDSVDWIKITIYLLLCMAIIIGIIVVFVVIIIGKSKQKTN